MENLKIQIDQLLNQLKERSLVQDKANLFEMIGKLEQAKAYLLAEVTRPFDPLSPGVLEDLPTGFQQVDDAALIQQPAHAAIDPLSPVVLEDLPTGFQQVDDAPPLQQQAHAADGDMAVLPQADHNSEWDPCDEHQFVPMTDLPVPWFTISLEKSKMQEFIEIPSKESNTLRGQGPPNSFINSPKFFGAGMPVTLTSSKVLSPGNLTTCPGLLMDTRKGMAFILCWPILGSEFEVGAMIRLSYQWKISGSKSKLFIIIEEVLEQAGPSNQTVGSKRPRVAG